MGTALQGTKVSYRSFHPSLLERKAHYVCYTRAKHRYMHVLQTKVQSITCSCSSPWVSLCIGTCCSIFFMSGSQTIRKASGQSGSSPGMQTMHMGKDAEEKEKNLGISSGCKSCCLKHSQRMSGLMKHRAGNLFSGSHCHPTLLPKYWLHSII